MLAMSASWKPIVTAKVLVAMVTRALMYWARVWDRVRCRGEWRRRRRKTPPRATLSQLSSLSGWIYAPEHTSLTSLGYRIPGVGTAEGWVGVLCGW